MRCAISGSGSGLSIGVQGPPGPPGPPGPSSGSLTVNALIAMLQSKYSTYSSWATVHILSMLYCTYILSTVCHFIVKTKKFEVFLRVHQVMVYVSLLWSRRRCEEIFLRTTRATRTTGNTRDISRNFSQLQCGGDSHICLQYHEWLAQIAENRNTNPGGGAWT